MPESVEQRRTRSWRRDNRLRSLGYESYAAYIESTVWKAKRREVWAHANNECAVCGLDARIVHHKTYERVGEEDLADLALFCPECHQLVHVLERRGDLGLDFDGLVGEIRKIRKPDPKLEAMKEILRKTEAKQRGKGKLAEEFAARQAKRIAQYEASTQ